MSCLAWRRNSANAVVGLLSAAALALVLSILLSTAATAQVSTPGAAPSLLDRIAGIGKPSYRGDDSCRYANDFVCDEPRLGNTDACSPGTDYSDCWRIALGREDDSCYWANDGVCDEPVIGTNNCTQMTDRTDCAAIAYLRFETDDCATSFNGVCEEPGVGNGTCDPRTDRSDCIGRERPMQIDDHFQGFDDRQRPDTGQFPWSVIGRLIGENGECTATLIADDILVSAAHCIEMEDGRTEAHVEFLTGAGLRHGPLSANVVSYFISPQHFSDIKHDAAGRSDWLLLKIDKPLGRALGFVPSQPINDSSAFDWDIRQGGFGWDTGGILAGHLGCSILALNDDNTIQHDCDTTNGDSGSPLMAFVDGRYSVTAVISHSRLVDDGYTINIAARSNEWMEYLVEFEAGRIGWPAQPASGGKGDRAKQ